MPEISYATTTPSLGPWIFEARSAEGKLTARTRDLSRIMKKKGPRLRNAGLTEASQITESIRSGLREGCSALVCMHPSAVSCGAD